MAEMNRINSFKSFTEVRNAEAANKLREENQTKRKELAQKFESILDEMGITSFNGLDEETQNNLISKILGKELNERNAFLGARAKAIEEDREEFEFNGKTYKVTSKSNVSEGNAFGDAVRKAKEAGEKEFEFEGKTYKVTEHHTDDPNDKYVVKPCDEEGTPWAVWEGDVRVECFETKEEAEEYAAAQNKEQGLEEGNAFGDAVRKAKEAGEKEFEFEGKTYKVTEAITEAIQVEGKRDAKKVVTVYNKIFNKSLVDFGAMSTESILGCIKYLMNEALHDANFHTEAEPTSKMIKGNIKPLEIKMPGLGGHFVKIGPKTIKEILDKYYSDIANAAGWGGIGIVEGTALYLEQIKQEAMGQQVLNKFNTMFEGEEVRVDVEARINEAKVLEAAAWEIGKDYPSYGVVVSVVHNDDLCEVTFDSGDKIVFRDTGSSWVQESVVTEAKFDKKSLTKAIKNLDDGIILVNGQEYIIYNPDNGNDDNAEMWGDKTIFALDQDGEEHEFKYSEIERFSESVVTEGVTGDLNQLAKDSKDFKDFVKNFNKGYKIPASKSLEAYLKTVYDAVTNESVVNEAEIKSDDEFKEYAFTVLKKAFGDDFDEAKGQEIVDGILSKSDGDYGAAVGMLTSSLG